MRVALLFTDGVGIGPRDPDRNPLARAELLLSQFDDGSGTRLPGGGRRLDVDATFGLPGRPQSATNQTAIYTGRPAPRLLGRHLLGFPNAPLRALLADHSIARRLTAASREVSFANAYPAAYLDAIGVPRRASRGPDLAVPARYLRKARASASTLAMAAGGVALRTFDDARADQALTHDIDGALAERRGARLPRRSPEEAAEIFWGIAGALTVFEHFLADEAGHLRDAAAALEALGTFDRFARAVVARRPDDAQVLICSDHGNVEDLSTRGHTRNPVALLSFGPAPARHFTPLTDVAGIGTTVLGLLGVA